MNGYFYNILYLNIEFSKKVLAFEPNYHNLMVLYNNLISNYKLLGYKLSFKNRLSQICESENIEFRNYLTLKELKDMHFYDLFHLNPKGSIVFTKKVLEDFKILKKDDIG